MQKAKVVFMEDLNVKNQLRLRFLTTFLDEVKGTVKLLAWVDDEVKRVYQSRENP